MVIPGSRGRIGAGAFPAADGPVQAELNGNPGRDVSLSVTGFVFKFCQDRDQYMVLTAQVLNFETKSKSLTEPICCSL